MSDPWWPEGVGYDNPAFRVKRQVYSDVEGGDYVRGSDATLDRSVFAPWLAITDAEGNPAPEPAPANLAALKGNTTYGDGHYTGPPHTPGQYVLLGDASAAHVSGRQSYNASGAPTTNNTVWTIGPYPGTAPSPVLPQTAVRYPSVNAVVEEGIGKGLLFARACGVDPAALGKPNYHVIEVRWGWPHEIEFTWQEVALVRSAFGHPTVPEDGETIYRKKRDAVGIDRVDRNGTPYTVPAPFIYDYGWVGAGTPSLNSGYWYYYTLFFRVNPVDWAAYMSDGVLLPTDYHHSDHLWETVPPFYQWTDDNIAVGAGYLRRFMTIFGYELDHAREYVESVQKAQYADFSPMSLLRHVGDNYGLSYEQGLGDIRYRALIANLARLHQIRGTRKGVEELIETGTKYLCDVTVGQNVMMLPDDSDFFNGTGNWAPLHPSTPAFVPPITAAPWGQVSYVSMTTVATPPLAGGSRGVMRIDTPVGVTQSVMMTCGDGKMPTKDIVPLYSGIPTESGQTIGFSVWIKAEAPSVVIPKLYLLWFDQSGQPQGMLSSSAGGPLGATTAWQNYPMQATAPENAVYVVPAILFESRSGSGAASGRSPYYDVSAVTIYKPGEGGASVAAVAPDRYLTMGDPSELLGAPDDDFTGYLMGAPGAEADSGSGGAVQHGVHFFSDFFRQYLFNHQTLMNGASVRLVLFRSAPDLSVVPPSYAAARTVAELEALLGWEEVRGIPGYPFSSIPVSTRADVGNSVYVMFNQFPFGDLSEPVGIEAVGFVFDTTLSGPIDGVSNPLILVTNTPTGTFQNIHATDNLTAQKDTTLAPGAQQWLFGWGKPPAGATTITLTEGPLVLYISPPSFEVSNTLHAWLYPQRANMVANPSFEGGTDFWSASSVITRVHEAAPNGGAWSARATGDLTNAIVVESNVFPARLSSTYFDKWTIQLKARSDGAIKVGLVYWDASYQQTAVDWGPFDESIAEYETFILGPDTWTPISVHRTGAQVKEAMVRIECNGSFLDIDQVLAEGDHLREWPYFDGDEKFSAPDSYSWYGGSARQGASYSMWYGNRRAVTGRMFNTGTDIIDPDNLVTDADVAKWGLVYQWTPAGVMVTPHIEVLYPNDLRAPVPPKTPDVVIPYTADGGRDGGVINPW